MERASKVLLVNFAPGDAKRLSRLGLSVDVGYIGPPESIPTGKLFLPVRIPHPPYDYDIYVYNSDAEGVAQQARGPGWRDFGQDMAVLDGLEKYSQSPFLRVSFIGSVSSLKTNLLGGAASVGLFGAHSDVSGFETLDEGTFSIKPLHAWMSRVASRIDGVYKYLGMADHYPTYGNPVICNRQGDIVAGYGTYHTNRTHLSYVVLPQFQDNMSILIDLLKTIALIEPELLPELTRYNWLTSSKYAFAEEIDIDKEIESALTQVDMYVKDKQQEKKEIANKIGFMRAILTATENAEQEQRLSTNVRKVLEFLDFKVTDIDDKLKKAIKKEDFWVEDDGFFAITEVSATINKNPKTKEYSDLLGRRSTIFQRRDLVPNVDASIVSGLLVLNYDIETDPDQRPVVYCGGEEEFVAAAEENSIGILSTVDLYRLAIAVKDGSLSKVDARAIIKTFGRILYKPTEKDTAKGSADS